MSKLRFVRGKTSRRFGARFSVRRDQFIASEVEKEVFGVLGGRVSLTKKDGVPKD